MQLYYDLAYLDTEFETKEEVFDFISDVLVKKNFVVDNYAQELKNREEEFPTGLDLGFNSIAIPHCDAKNAFVDTLYFIRNKTKIHFKNMEDDSDIYTNLIIGIVISNPENQVDTLVKLIDIFQDEELMIIFKMDKSKGRILNILQERLIKNN